MGKIICLGAMLMFAAVSAGAFGAHALRDRLDEYSRGVYEKAVFYHFVHALSILILASFAALKVLDQQSIERAVWLMAVGIMIFSGTLYLLAVTGMKWLGAITPIGGTLFLISWALVAWNAWRAG